MMTWVDAHPTHGGGGHDTLCLRCNADLQTPLIQGQIHALQADEA